MGAFNWKIFQINIKWWWDWCWTLLLLRLLLASTLSLSNGVSEVQLETRGGTYTHRDTSTDILQNAKLCDKIWSICADWIKEKGQALIGCSPPCNRLAFELINVGRVWGRVPQNGNELERMSIVFHVGRKVYGVMHKSQASVLDGFNLIFIIMHTKTRSKLTSATYNNVDTMLSQ